MLLHLLLLSAPVTLRVDGAPVSEVLHAISYSRGLHLTADARTRGEIMVIDVKDVTADWLFDSIAKANGAVWVATKNGYELTQTASLRKADIALENARRAEVLRGQLPSRLAPLQRHSPAMLDGPPGPEERLAIRFASTIGPASLAEIPLNTRVVWTNAGRPSSRPLTHDPYPILQAYLQDEKDAFQDEAESNLPEFLSTDKIVVSAIRSSWAGEAVSVRVLSADGKPKLAASTILRVIEAPQSEPTPGSDPIPRASPYRPQPSRCSPPGMPSLQTTGRIFRRPGAIGFCIRIDMIRSSFSSRT